MNLYYRYYPYFIATALFFCFHHYGGIILDAILYLLQGVHSVKPERFFGDPSFDFGNQDSFGFFSPLVRFFINAFGVSAGMKILCVTSQFGWCIAVIFFLKQILVSIKSEKYFIPILLFFFFVTAPGMPHTKVHFFRLVETYSCSRQLALDIGIFAVALILFEKKWISIVLALVGTAIHPLTAGWVIPLWIFYYFPKTRVPIVALSFFIPFSAFIHYGKLDFLPSDWLGRPLAFAPTKSIIFRNCSCFLFFGCIGKNFFDDVRLVRFFQSICIIILIAFYWNAWGGWGEHIFFYQVQPWRVEWLCTIVSLPVYMVLFIKEFGTWWSTKLFTTRTFSIFLMGLSLLLPESLFALMVVAVYFATTKPKRILEEHFGGILCYFVLFGFAVQQYIIFCLEGYPAVFGFDYQWLYHLRDTLFLGQFISAVIVSICFTKQKRYILSILLVVFCFFPKFQLLPIWVMTFYLLSRRKKINVPVLFCFAILVLFDSLYDVSLRQDNLLVGLPNNVFLNVGMLCLVLFAFYFTSILNRKGWTKLAFLPGCISLVVCISIAIINYDFRPTSQRRAENQLNEFYTNPVFPEVRNSGRTFFLVKGTYSTDARLQFLSGAYLSGSSHVGEIFFREHYLEVQKRENLMLYNENRFEVTGESTYAGIVEHMLSDTSYRDDRLNFLCDFDEIEYIVSNFDLPYVVKNSKKIYGDEKIYLYSCREDVG